MTWYAVVTKFPRASQLSRVVLIPFVSFLFSQRGQGGAIPIDPFIEKSLRCVGIFPRLGEQGPPRLIVVSQHPLASPVEAGFAKARV